MVWDERTSLYLRATDGGENPFTLLQSQTLTTEQHTNSTIMRIYLLDSNELCFYGKLSFWKVV